MYARTTFALLSGAYGALLTGNGLKVEPGDDARCKGPAQQDNEEIDFPPIAITGRFVANAQKTSKE